MFGRSIIKSKIESEGKTVKDILMQILESQKRMENDISGLKIDVSGLKEDVAVLKQDVSGLREDVIVLKNDVKRLDLKTDRIEETVNRIEVNQEENVLGTIILLKHKLEAKEKENQVLNYRLFKVEAKVQ